LEETKEEVHRLTSSTNATAHPTNEATRMLLLLLRIQRRMRRRSIRCERRSVMRKIQM
jgi:hypothetical protein